MGAALVRLGGDTMTKGEALKELIEHCATAPTVSPLETMFDIVAHIPWAQDKKDEWDKLIYERITNHKAY